MTSEGLVPTRTFLDQEHGRETVWHAASKATAEILYLLDASTGPSGGDTEDAPPSKKEAAAYDAFRAWFGPQIASVIQSVAIGPIISSILFEPQGGGIILDRGVALGTGRICEPISGRNKTAARAAWLITEISSLQDFYCELYENELEQMRADCGVASEFDFVDGDMVEAVDVLSNLETWHMFAQPGARFMRGDKMAIENSRSLIEQAKRFVEKMEAERSALEEALGTDSLSTVNEAVHAKQRIQEHAAKIEELQSRIEGLCGERGRLIDLVDEYERGADG